MNTLSSIVALSIILIIVQESVRRAKRTISGFIFLAVPIILTPLWIFTNDFGVFAWAKLYTIILTACWLWSLRFTALYDQQWARVVLIRLFQLNILEAVAVDISAWRWASILNAASGTFLLMALPRSIEGVSRCRPHADLDYKDISRGWMTAFSLWNIAFLYLHFPVIVGHHIAVLGSTLIVGLYEPRRWLQCRIITLSLDLVLLASFSSILVPALDTSEWHTADGEIVVATISLIACTVCVTYQYYRSLFGETKS